MRQRITSWLWLRRPIRRDGRGDDAMHGAGGFVDLKLGHYTKDGIEVVDVGGEIDIYYGAAAP